MPFTLSEAALLIFSKLNTIFVCKVDLFYIIISIIPHSIKHLCKNPLEFTILRDFSLSCCFRCLFWFSFLIWASQTALAVSDGIKIFEEFGKVGFLWVGFCGGCGIAHKEVISAGDFCAQLFGLTDFLAGLGCPR